MGLHIHALLSRAHLSSHEWTTHKNCTWIETCMTTTGWWTWHIIAGVKRYFLPPVFAPRFRRLCLDSLKIRHFGKTLVMSHDNSFCDVCQQLGAGIFTVYLRHISTSRAHNNKIPMFSESYFLMVPLPVSRDIDICQKSKIVVAKMKGCCRYLLYCHLMSCHGRHPVFDRNENSAIRPADYVNPTL